MKKRTLAVMMGLVVLASAGCGNSAEETAGDSVEGTEVVAADKVALFLSGSESEVYDARKESFQSGLMEKGYEPVISYAGDDSDAQIQQIKEVMEQEPKLLIIDPVDVYALGEILESVKEQEISVISYDRLIMDTDAVSYYVTYDYRGMGQMAGNAVKEAENLEQARTEQRVLNIELFMGSQDSLEALLYYNGMIDVLKEYLDAGTLVCPSGQLEFDANGVLRWDSEVANKRCKDMLDNYYSEGTSLDIVCTGFDGASDGVVLALEEAGFVSGSEQWPLIVGAGKEDTVEEILSQGKIEYITYTSEDALAARCLEMVNGCVAGEQFAVDRSSGYDNGVKVIPTNLSAARLMNKADIQSQEAENVEEVTNVE